MARLFAVNDQNDIFSIPGGQIALSNGQAAVGQHAEHAVKTLLSEMIYARDRGIDYDSTVFDGSPNLLAFEAAARAQIDRIPDVISITAFDANLSGNAVDYRATLQTRFGEVSINGGL
ncbi:MAG: hypothetical protein K8963_03780 [Proteobacteria bacterium]|nr:hypothetical protein [Pseudomonadota bacterium]